MTRHLGYKYRIYPTKEQACTLNQMFGCVRFVYNHYLTERTENPKLNYYDCQNDLPSLKEEYPFLKETDSMSLQMAVRALFSAFDKKQKPRYKSKRKHKDSYTTCFIHNNIAVLDKGHIKLPKLKTVKAKIHRDLPENARIKRATITRTPSGKYFVSFTIEFESSNEVNVSSSKTGFLGLDYSSPHMYVDSNGNKADMPHYYRNTLEKLAYEQKILSKKEKGSKRYEKQRIKVAKLQEKAANQRRDFQHKLSREIANSYIFVCVEDINMIEYQKDTEEFKLNKATLDNGFGQFRTFLDYKLTETGGRLLRVNKWFASSKTCHYCGKKNTSLKLTDRVWECDRCHTVHGRDVNAAINLRNKGVEMMYGTVTQVGKRYLCG